MATADVATTGMGPVTAYEVAELAREARRLTRAAGVSDAERLAYLDAKVALLRRIAAFCWIEVDPSLVADALVQAQAMRTRLSGPAVGS